MTTTDITINVEDLTEGDEIVAYNVWTFDHGTQVITGSWVVGSVHWMAADRLADVYTNHGLLGFQRGDKVTVRRTQTVETDAATEPETATDTTAATRIPTGSMRRTRCNTLHAAAATAKALGYRTLSGLVAAAVEQGRLVRTGDFLDRIGGSDLPTDSAPGSAGTSPRPTGRPPAASPSACGHSTAPPDATCTYSSTAPSTTPCTPASARTRARST